MAEVDGDVVKFLLEKNPLVADMSKKLEVGRPERQPGRPERQPRHSQARSTTYRVTVRKGKGADAGPAEEKELQDVVIICRWGVKESGA